MARRVLAAALVAAALLGPAPAAAARTRPAAAAHHHAHHLRGPHWAGWKHRAGGCGPIRFVPGSRRGVYAPCPAGPMQPW